MKTNQFLSAFALFVAVAAVVTTLQLGEYSTARADDQIAPRQDNQESARDPDQAAIERSRKTVKMLDNIFKQTIVLITDKYVHDEDDFAAGSAAVLLFKNISDAGENKVRLLDATGDPFDAENIAKDQFEREGIKRLKAGAKNYEQVATKEGKSYLRALTPVPVVMEKCIMCHANYEGVKKGAPIGAISYTVPIE